MVLIVTAEAYPHGVRCHACKRVIEDGEPYQLRDLATGKPSVPPYDSDSTDVPVCAGCPGSPITQV